MNWPNSFEPPQDPGQSALVDAREPKNGDFVKYVEQFVQLPQGVSASDAAPPLPPSSGIGAGGDWGNSGTGKAEKRRSEPVSMPRPLRKPERGAQQASPGAGQTFDLEAEMLRAFDKLASSIPGISSLLIFAGIGLLALSFSSFKPFPLDPEPGIGLLIVGLVLRRLARKRIT
ncbi:MAG: hypothetical protein VW339_00915 [Quisquiliibacterium sp.]